MLFTKYPLASRLMTFLVLPIVLFVLYWYQQYVQSLPSERATLNFASLNNEVSVAWDPNGVPKIQASTLNDVYFATGFAHAADRLWQLEIQRRMVAGSLSEVFGSQFLMQDIWIKMLGLESAANSALQSLSPEAMQSLESYSNGVNAWLQSNPQLPPEFDIFGITPKAWKPVDSLGWSKMFALNLSSNMFSELTRVAAKEILNDAQFNDVYPAAGQETQYPDINMDIASLFTTLVEHKHFNEQVMKSGGRNVGSNGWVLSGEHTKSGKPTLANDPHLGLQIPSLWYVVDQVYPANRTTGMSLVGLPLIIFGRNNHIAWGGTNMMADVQDLYVEKLNPKNPNQYLSKDGSWKSFQTQQYHIQVKAGFPASLRDALKPVMVNVRHTENGPVVSDFRSPNDTVFSLKWTALLSDDTSYDAFLQITQATNWKEFNEAANLLQAPTLNLLYADEKHIGYKGAGLVPIRSAGNGTMPAPGWLSEYQWQGFIPKDNLPVEFDPKSGIIISANNDPTPADYPYFISSEWASPARAERIGFLLNSAMEQYQKVPLQVHRDIQSDQTDNNYLQLVPLLTRVETNSERELQLITALQAWKGDMSLDSGTALLLAMWIPELKKQLFDDEFKGSFLQADSAELLRNMLAIAPNRLTIAALAGNSQGNWCDNVLTTEVENCADILRISFTTSLNEIEKLIGTDAEDWRLGDTQYASYAHFPLSQIKVLGEIFEREIANGGGGDSINVAPSIFKPTDGLVQTFGAGFRQIIEPGVNGAYQFMNSTGQSGNIFSQHYDDMVQPFHNVKFLSLGEKDETVASYILKPSH